MSWEEILEVVIARTKHERYRALCEEGAPDWKLWRSRVIDQYYGLEQIEPRTANQIEPPTNSQPAMPCCP